jgi:hypothetical protein
MKGGRGPSPVAQAVVGGMWSSICSRTVEARVKRDVPGGLQLDDDPEQDRCGRKAVFGRLGLA